MRKIRANIILVIDETVLDTKQFMLVLNQVLLRGLPRSLARPQSASNITRACTTVIASMANLVNFATSVANARGLTPRPTPSASWMLDLLLSRIAEQF